MKHPSHKTAKNEYSGRTTTKISKSGKESLQDEMKRFHQHMLHIIEKNNIDMA